MEESRTKKTTRNTAYALASKGFDVVFSFILRTVFIRTLGSTYLGLSGLFGNILIVLSLMELGVGSAIVFSLYRPLAEHNYGKIAALMDLYKKVYRLIGILVCVIGFLLTPALPYIINLPEKVDHLYLIYWITIVNTGSSYFLAYRRSLLIADQRSDINTKNDILFRFIRFVLLTAILVFSHNYILYLSAEVLNTIASNVCINFKVKKMYRAVENAELDKITPAEKQDILKFMRSGIFFKIGQTVVNCTDNILISAFVNTVIVGLYSNYLLIISSLQVFLSTLFSGITASIGNYAVQNDGENSEKLFQKIFFVNFSLSYYLTVCVSVLINPFISLWVGQDFLLSKSVVLLLSLNFYISTLQLGAECFLASIGKMFYHNRFRSLIESVVNLVVSIVLVKFTPLGVSGVFLGTTVCFLCGRIWMDVHTLYKYWFHLPFGKYVKKYVLYFVFSAAVGVLCFVIRNALVGLLGLTILSWILCGIAVSAVSLLLLFLVFRKNEGFSFIVTTLRRYIRF